MTQKDLTNLYKNDEKKSPYGTSRRVAYPGRVRTGQSFHVRASQ